MHPTERDWLAVCLITESNQAHEWGFIAWAIRNRVAAKRFPDTVRDVVLQPWQFSHFNAWVGFSGTDAELLAAVLAGTGALRGKVKPLSRSLYALAQRAAADLLEDPVWRRPFALTVCHYWSPVSMVKGKTPAWAPSAKRLFTPSGVDPERFIFADGVA